MARRKNEFETRKDFLFLACVLCLMPACLFAQSVSTVAVADLSDAPQVGVRQQTAWGLKECPQKLSAQKPHQNPSGGRAKLRGALSPLFRGRVSHSF